VLGGLNAYEVIGAYRGDGDAAFLFRLADHLERLRRSAHVMRLPPHGYTDEELRSAVNSVAAASAIRGDALIRVVHYLGSGPLFSYRSDEVGSGVFVFAKPAPADPAPDGGISVATSSWTRLPDVVAPPRVKCGANYHNARLAQLQAQADGYDDALLLNALGRVAELPLATLFLVRDGVLVTPSLASGILEGITRRTIVELAPELELQVQERDVERSELYVADEAFACGTGREVWPILSIDRYVVGDGAVGPITASVRGVLQRVIRGRAGARPWLTPVAGAATVSAVE